MRFLVMAVLGFGPLLLQNLSFVEGIFEGISGKKEVPSHCHVAGVGTIVEGQRVMLPGQCKAVNCLYSGDVVFEYYCKEIELPDGCHLVPSDSNELPDCCGELQCNENATVEDLGAEKMVGVRLYAKRHSKRRSTPRKYHQNRFGNQRDS